MKKTLMLLFLLVFVQAGFCEITNEIRYNGRLKGYTVPLGGGTQRSIRFEYHRAASGGSYFHAETHGVTPNADGVFSVILNPDINWQQEGDVYLELWIDNRRMEPREKIMSQPYAQHARTADRAKTAETARDGNPPGTIIAFAGARNTQTDNTLRTRGYLPCNGGSWAVNDYPELAAVLAGLYGNSTDPVPGTTFTVPNFQGMFLRGAGSNTVTTNPGGTVTITAAGLGVKQADAIRNITATWGGVAWNTGGDLGSGAVTYSSKSGNWSVGQSANQSRYWDFAASKVVPTDSENRPANYAVNYYIKY